MKAALGLFFLLWATAHAGPTVYKCEKDGVVAYSDKPCLGATKVDATPTKGLNKWTGVVRKGDDVRREDSQEELGKALQPATGMTPEQRLVYHRRAKLDAQSRLECGRLDRELPDLEEADRDAKPKDKKKAELALFLARERAWKLKC